MCEECVCAVIHQKRECIQSFSNCLFFFFLVKGFEFTLMKIFEHVLEAHVLLTLTTVVSWHYLLNIKWFYIEYFLR